MFSDEQIKHIEIQAVLLNIIVCPSIVKIHEWLSSIVAYSYLHHEPLALGAGLEPAAGFLHRINSPTPATNSGTLE